MRAVDIIMKKRNKESISCQEIEFLIQGYVNGSIPEYQISAFTMAVYFNGMTFEETAALTNTMLHSGKTMNLSGIQGPFIDKHSTGGVGDKISLILAPLVASCGIKDPMMSGRSLGHTGGTLDKLDSIPGYKTRLTEDEFRIFLQKDGFAMTGQTQEIVPADRLLYSLRDVCATVESIPLITASILSKKVAEGADKLVFDVKSGKGAFMKTFEDAEKLAMSLTLTGKEMGKEVVSVITNMDEPLGYTIGNFFEIEETIDSLQGKGPQDIMELTYKLASWMLILGGKAENIEEALLLSKKAISSGKAYDLFLANVTSQGGNVEKMLSLKGNYRSKHIRTIHAPQNGIIQSIDAYKMGMASVYLGAGRSKTDDPVYPDVGIILNNKQNDSVKKGDELCTIYGKDTQSLDIAEKQILDAYTYGQEKTVPKSIILKEIKA